MMNLYKKGTYKYMYVWHAILAFFLHKMFEFFKPQIFLKFWYFSLLTLFPCWIRAASSDAR